MLGDEKIVYCIDTNILIQAWHTYYSLEICPSYWEVLNDLGKKGVLFIPQEVYEEVKKGEDNLFVWLKKSDIPIKKIDEEVISCYKKILASNSSHNYLMAQNGRHSKADPWVIAHAMKEKAIVVTKEKKDVISKKTKIKIPHVCDNMNVSWVDDFEFIRNSNIKFTCELQ